MIDLKPMSQVQLNIILRVVEGILELNYKSFIGIDVDFWRDFGKEIAQNFKVFFFPALFFLQKQKTEFSHISIPFKHNLKHSQLRFIS